MFSIIKNIVSELNKNLEGFAGVYLGKYDISTIDNSKDNIFYLKTRNEDTTNVVINGSKEPARIVYELSLIIQYAKNINTDILFKKAMFSINSACRNKATNISVSYDSAKIAEDETGLKLKTDINLMRINFTYNYAIWLRDCNECLTDVTC